MSQDNVQLASTILGNASLTIGPAPDHDSVRQLISAGVTHIATVLSADEDGERVRSLCQQYSLTWLWLPYSKTVDSSESELEHVRNYVQQLADRVNEGASIYLHCDDSLNRCLLLTYALLHKRRLPSAQAFTTIHRMAPAATHKLNKQDLQWAAMLGEALR